MPATAPARTAPFITTDRPSHLLRFAGAEEAAGPEDQDQHQDQERDHVLGARTGTGRGSRSATGTDRSTRIPPRIRPPSAAPGMLPIPPSTAAVKAAMPGRKPIVAPTGRTSGHTARRRCRPASRRSRTSITIDAIDVDAHQARDLAILGHGAHRVPGARALHEQLERDHHDDRRHDAPPGRSCRSSRPAIVHVALEERGARIATGLRSEEPLRGVLQEERCADRGDQGDEPRRVPQRAVADALEQNRDPDRDRVRPPGTGSPARAIGWLP